MTIRRSTVAMSIALSLSAWTGVQAQKVKPAKPDHDMREMQKDAAHEAKEIAKAQDKHAKAIAKEQKEVAKDAKEVAKNASDARPREPKAEERREHRSFTVARQQSQRLTKSVRLTAAQRAQFEAVRKRYDSQYRALEKEEMQLDKAHASDADVLRRLDALSAQERAELRGILTPAQQLTFDRNVAGARRGPR